MKITVDALKANGHGHADVAPFSVEVALAVDGVHHAYRVRCHPGIVPNLAVMLLEPDAAFRRDMAAAPRAKGRVLQIIGRLLAGEAVALPMTIDSV